LVINDLLIIHSAKTSENVDKVAHYSSRTKAHARYRPLNSYLLVGIWARMRNNPRESLSRPAQHCPQVTCCRDQNSSTTGECTARLFPLLFLKSLLG
jgi:hypothetical protein